MSKRLSRVRLFNINQQGMPSPQTAGIAFSSSIRLQTKTAEGSLTTTDMQIDLGSSLGALTSFASVGAGATGQQIVGVSSSSGTHGDAQMMLLDASSSAQGLPMQGVVTSAELVCVEVPIGGGTHLGVWYGSAASGSGNDMQTGGVELIAAETYTAIGDSAVVTDISVDIDNQYLYLVHSGSTAATYTAGKFVLRLFGYTKFADV